MPLPTAFGHRVPSQRSARTYKCTGFNVVATPFNDYRVDAVIEGIENPVPGPSFPTLEMAKQHITLTQKALSDSVVN